MRRYAEKLQHHSCPHATAPYGISLDKHLNCFIFHSLIWATIPFFLEPLLFVELPGAVLCENDPTAGNVGDPPTTGVRCSVHGNSVDYYSPTFRRSKRLHVRSRQDIKRTAALPKVHPPDTAQILGIRFTPYLYRRSQLVLHKRRP